jgi:transcription initiation factor TFIID subunit 2
MISRTSILKLLLSVMSNDRSPFVRDSLFKIFCRGVAAIAFGENKKTSGPATAGVEMDDGGLIVEQGDAITEARKLELIRKEDIREAVKALKNDLKDSVDFQISIWRAAESSSIGLKEKRNMLELCGSMFEEDDSLLMTFKYPKVWKVERVVDIAGRPGFQNGQTQRKQPKQCMVRFSSHYRTTPRNQIKPEQTVVAPEVRPPEPKKIKLQSRSSIAGPSTSISTPASTISVQPSLSIALPHPASDSIAVQPLVRPATPATAPTPAASPSQTDGIKSLEKRPKAPKRKSDDGEPSNRPKKAAKTESNTAGGKPSRVVTVKFTKWSKLSESNRKQIGPPRETPAEASTIIATPAAARPAHLPPAASSSPTVAEHPSSTPPGSSSSQPVAPPSAKPRKPLPSSAPHSHPQQLHGPVSGVSALPPQAPAPAARPIIKLKVKKPSTTATSQPR